MRQKLSIILILLGLVVLLFAIKSGFFKSSKDSYADQKLPEVVDYNFHIKPILSDNCYTCHGPDANKRKAGLRLDLESNAFSELPENPGKYPIVAGKPGNSLMYQHVVTDDSKQLMPPPDSQLALNPTKRNC